MNRDKGIVYWITGLSGAGKTTIGKYLYKKIRESKNNVVFLDGDITRQVYNDDIGYSKEDRLKGASRHSRVCKMLAEQGLDVICCTIGMFDTVRKWNRENIENYWEVFLDPPIEVLQKRDPKGLYSRARKGTEQNVVGVNLTLELPKHPDMQIANDGTVPPEIIAEEIWERCH